MYWYTNTKINTDARMRDVRVDLLQYKMYK